MFKAVLSLIGCLVFLGSSVFAQQNDPLAAELLSKVSDRYKSYKSYKVSYVRTIENAKGVVQSTEKSIAWISGNMFYIVNAETEIICNGTTIWNFNRESNEVNIYDYDAENDELNPTRVFNAYKTGYRYAMAGEVSDGKSVLQNIELEPEDRKKDIAKIRVVLNKAEKSIKRWILFQRGTNTKIIFSISKFTPNPAGLDNTIFTFNKAKYPKVKLIDLR